MHSFISPSSVSLVYSKDWHFCGCYVVVVVVWHWTPRNRQTRRKLSRLYLDWTDREITCNYRFRSKYLWKYQQRDYISIKTIVCRIWVVAPRCKSFRVYLMHIALTHSHTHNARSQSKRLIFSKFHSLLTLSQKFTTLFVFAFFVFVWYFCFADSFVQFSVFLKHILFW